MSSIDWAGASEEPKAAAAADDQGHTMTAEIQLIVTLRLITVLFYNPRNIAAARMFFS
jgi:hypothetical protein